MHKPLPPTKLAQLIHDLAGPLTVLSMCFPEVHQKVEQGRGSHPSDLHLKKCADLCEAALEETLQRLKKLQRYIDVVGF